MILFVLALLWSIHGHVDIVAVAPGRIIVSDRTKVIQPLQASVVKAVLVKDGDRVQAGHVLVELDPTMATADIAGVQEQLKTQASEVLRTRELLKMLSKQKLPAKVLSWLQPDLPLNNQGEGIALRDATSITTTIRIRTGALAASGSPSAEMPQDAATQAQLQSEWQDVQAKLTKIDLEAARRQAELDTVKQTIPSWIVSMP
jgi:hemolysin D